MIGLQVTTRFGLPVPLTGLQDGWLAIPLPESGPELDLAEVLDQLTPELDLVHTALLHDIAEEVKDTPLGDLRNDPTIKSGLLTLYDPATWAFTSVSDPSRDALEMGEADAFALFALAYQMLIRVSAGSLDQFLHEELGRGIWGVVDLRGRLDDDREDRHLLRRGLRGARRRRRKIGEDGHRRDFRVAQARSLTYTEILLGLHEMGVANILHPPAGARWIRGMGIPGPGIPEPRSPGPGSPASPPPRRARCASTCSTTSATRSRARASSSTTSTTRSSPPAPRARTAEPRSRACPQSTPLS